MSMKILFYDMGSYTYKDFIYYLRKMGHTCKTVYYHFPDRFEDAYFCERFEGYLKEDTYDCVISVNFFPLVAKLCYERGIQYISWCYDSPLSEDLVPYFDYETNAIFLFDRIEVEQYRAAGHTKVFHLPLAVNTDRLDALQFTDRQIADYSADISFVGQLYQSALETLVYFADDYTKGYIEALIQAQLRIYGYYMIEELVTEELLEAVNSSIKKAGQTNLTLNHRGFSCSIATQVTHLERSFLLEVLGEMFDTHFYTTDQCDIPNVKICGPAKYFDEMPGIFRYSKLNLNPTLKCIQSGIPLRALDIMGAGGVLLANYQPELAEYFADGQDVILYSGMEDAVAKAEFYLQHDDLRRQIGHNGYQIVKEAFNYPKQIARMFDIAKQ